jgi:cellulase/cellobiase CelA1
MVYSLKFKVDSSWNTGFTGSISLTNSNLNSMNGWTIEFDAPFEITNLWNGQIVSHVGNHYIIRNASWNGTVGPNGTASFGFQATTLAPSHSPPGTL